MKQIFFISCALAILHLACNAQAPDQKPGNSKLHLGIKAGPTFSSMKQVTNYSSLKAEGGYSVGVFLSRNFHQQGLSFRTELIYSTEKMRYNRDSPQDYLSSSHSLSLPHLIIYTPVKFVQLQAGGQLTYLLSATAKSSSSNQQSVSDYYKRLGYGITGGLELHPFKGLLVGARYTISLGSPFASPSTQPFPFNVSTSAWKNGTTQIFAGYTF